MAMMTGADKVVVVARVVATATVTATIVMKVVVVLAKAVPVRAEAQLALVLLTGQVERTRSTSAQSAVSGRCCSTVPSKPDYLPLQHRLRKILMLLWVPRTSFFVAAHSR